MTTLQRQSDNEIVIDRLGGREGGREGYVHVCVTSIEVDQVERIKKKEEAI